MERYSYETAPGVFNVLDRQRRSDRPIATCKSRDDAEKIVNALNIVPVYRPSDPYWTTPRPWKDFR